VLHHCALSSISSIPTTRPDPRSGQDASPARGQHVSDCIREAQLAWKGREYQYDFAFENGGVILETNGRRWHDDPRD
jgi:hypothetical protein